MTASIEFFPVGNGDMTLIRLQSGKTILVDINIRQKANQENEDQYPNVAKMLKERLERDTERRLFVDVFMLSHPDQDHISGLSDHFHLGAPSTLKNAEEGEPEKILIREMWSSPLTFRRKKDIDGSLSPEAQRWKDEASRRVKLFRKGDGAASQSGNYIRVLGEDIKEDKTKGIEPLLVKTGETLDEICRVKDPSFSALLLSPQIVTKEQAKELSGKNNSSIVMQFSLSGDKNHNTDARFLTGGDAEVDIWRRIWNRNKSSSANLEYEILQTPHHCSLGALSYDNYSDQNGKEGKGEECHVDEVAWKALSGATGGAFIVGSMDVPERESGRGLARRKYSSLADSKNGQMLCTMDESKDRPLKLTIGASGPTRNGYKTPPPVVPKKPDKGKTDSSYA